jgi:hypothetical protein
VKDLGGCSQVLYTGACFGALRDDSMTVTIQQERDGARSRLSLLMLEPEDYGKKYRALDRCRWQTVQCRSETRTHRQGSSRVRGHQEAYDAHPTEFTHSSPLLLAGALAWGGDEPPEGG